MECFICGSSNIKSEDNLPLLIKHIKCDNCGEFYLEPVFYSRYEAFLLRYGNNKRIALNQEMERLVKKYKKVYFVGNFDHPMIENIAEDFIYQEFNDILNKLGFIVDDNSRGSDYGD